MAREPIRAGAGQGGTESASGADQGGAGRGGTRPGQGRVSDRAGLNRTGGGAESVSVGRASDSGPGLRVWVLDLTQLAASVSLSV